MKKKQLAEKLVREGYLKTRNIIVAFLAVDRADFVPESMREYAYADAPLPIGNGQTISQPLTVAFMIELLGPKTGDLILDIGAGSGWQTALLSYIAHPREEESGKLSKPLVIGIERLPELAEFARMNVGKYGFIENGVAKIIEGDGAKGAEEYGSFDRIIAAASTDVIPEAWKNQLKVGGRIVAPGGESIVVLAKIGADEFEQKQYFGFRFVPLITEE